MQDNNTTPPSDNPTPTPTPTPPEISPAPGATPVVPPVPAPATESPVNNNDAPEASSPEATTPAAATPQAGTQVPGAKNHLVAVLLSIFVGTLGVDRFYLGHIGLGVAKLLLSWLTFGIWWLVDVILIATRKVKNVTWED